MSRLWKVPSAIAEYTVGTVIVLMQVGVIRPLEDRAMRRREELGAMSSDSNQWRRPN
jgi:hypothetical protein